MSLWRDFSSVGFPNFIGNKFFFWMKSWNFRAGLVPAVIQFLLDLTYILDLLIIFWVIRLLFLIANLHCKRSDVMAGCAGVSLTSWSPFAVSWNTPVFWEVSRWDFSALFPIWTRRQAETVCLSQPNWTCCRSSCSRSAAVKLDFQCRWQQLLSRQDVVGLSPGMSRQLKRVSSSSPAVCVNEMSRWNPCRERSHQQQATGCRRS